MQRTITITAPSPLVASLAEKLRGLDQVLALNVLPGAGVKPAGDVLLVHVLNRGTDDVLRLAQGVLGSEGVIVTAEAASASVLGGEQPPPKDVDEATWEEMESGLRQNGQVTPN